MEVGFLVWMGMDEGNASFSVKGGWDLCLRLGFVGGLE